MASRCWRYWRGCEAYGGLLGQERSRAHWSGTRPTSISATPSSANATPLLQRVRPRPRPRPEAGAGLISRKLRLFSGRSLTKCEQSTIIDIWEPVLGWGRCQQSDGEGPPQRRRRTRPPSGAHGCRRRVGTCDSKESRRQVQLSQPVVDTARGGGEFPIGRRHTGDRRVVAPRSATAPQRSHRLVVFSLHP